MKSQVSLTTISETLGVFSTIANCFHTLPPTMHRHDSKISKKPPIIFLAPKMEWTFVLVVCDFGYKKVKIHGSDTAKICKTQI